MNCSAVLSVEALGERIATLPRKRIAALPTALEDLPRLAADCHVGRFYVKRDDLTGIAMGGNKSRAMEFILGEAVSRGCDTLVAGGGTEQSNHAVQCVASANRIGLETVVVLQRRADARSNGNELLRRILGAQAIWIDGDSEFRERTSGITIRSMHEVAQQLIASGRRPYVLESSLHPLSVIAYVEAVRELCGQLGAESERPTRLYVTSEGAALGGLLMGVRLLNLPWQVTGLAWRPQEPGSDARLLQVIRSAASKLRIDCPVSEKDITVLPTGGPAYGVGSEESWSALSKAARMEGLFLDPVYTAKGMAGTLEDLAKRSLHPGERVIFVHTGGVGAVFAYEAELRRYVTKES